MLGGAGDHCDQLSHEGLGPGGEAVLLESMTQNRNRTVACYFLKPGSLLFSAKPDESAQAGNTAACVLVTRYRT